MCAIFSYSYNIYMPILIGYTLRKDTKQGRFPQMLLSNLNRFHQIFLPNMIKLFMGIVSVKFNNQPAIYP